MAAHIEEVSADIAGQKLKVTGQNLNHLFTILGCFFGAIILVILYQHQQDAKDAAKEFVGAIKEQTVAVKEQTVAQREQNCLIRFDPKDRQQHADFCKQIAR